MFWVDRIVSDICIHFADKRARGETLHVRDEKTLSGRPHIGSIRSASVHAFIVDALREQGVAVEYMYEINDTDAFDAVPVYVPADYAEYLGMRLCDVPSPSGMYANYAEEVGAKYLETMTASGFKVGFYRQSENYAAGKYDDFIRTALDKKEVIRRIYKEVSGSQKDVDWFPLQMKCEGCGKIGTTVVTGWDGEEASYTCTGVTWATGCGHAGKRSPFRGNATLPWKVEWAAKWCVNGTDIEAAGKDHYAAGGSRLVANRISEEVFGSAHPFDVRHEFILVGGAKMSSSKGIGATADEIASMVPLSIFRFFLLQKDPMKALDFSPEGDTIPLLFDAYDAAAREYHKPDTDAEKNRDMARLIELVHVPVEGRVPPLCVLPKFSQIVFLAQMPHLDIRSQVEEIVGHALSEGEVRQLDERLAYARKWLDTVAPLQYRCVFGDYSAAVVPDEVEREILREVCAYLQANPAATGHAIHAELHALKTRMNLEPKKLFGIFYRLLLGRENGPQLGFMLGALPREEVVGILGRV